MPFRSPKMYSFIFGFQRLVWWPKCTPASSRSFIAIPGKLPPSICRFGGAQHPTLLTFAELEPLPRASQPVLLAFLDARIRCQQPVLLQLLSQLRVVLDERARNRQTDGAGLSGNTTSIDRGEDVELFAGLGEQQRSPHKRPQRVGREVLVELAVINSNGALARAEENAGGGRFATARCVIFDACQLCDLDFPGLLGGMWMVAAGVHLQLPVHRITHLGFRQHAANRFLHETYRLALPHHAGALLTQPAFVSAVIAVHLLV